MGGDARGQGEGEEQEARECGRHEPAHGGAGVGWKRIGGVCLGKERGASQGVSRAMLRRGEPEAAV